MKILITGGGGFQGSHLAKALLDGGHTVSVLNTYSERSKENLQPIINHINLIWGSITDREIVEKSVRGHDVVYHLAAHINVDESLKDPHIFYYSNVLGTANILEAVRRQPGTKLIYASTCEVYGDGHDLRSDESLNETAELRPNSPYAASKAAADRLCYAYHKSFNVSVTIVRPFNIYGEHQKQGAFGALIPILTARAMRHEPLVVFGDGEASRDYLHVSDAVQGYQLVLNNTSSLQGRAINFASGANTKVKDIAAFIANKFSVPIVHGAARPGEVSRFPADISLAKSLGFVPRISIWEGIEIYLAWAKAHYAFGKESLTR